MINNKIAYFSHRIMEPEVLEKLLFLNNNEKKSLDEKMMTQFVLFKKILNFAYENNFYYKNLLNTKGIHPDDIALYEDIEKIPITTKQDIIDNYKYFEDMVPPNPFIKKHTGGTTGAFLHYKMDKEALYFGKAKLIRGWGYGGYTLGDKLATIAGGSLLPQKAGKLKRYLLKYLLSKINLSAADMSDAHIQKQIALLNEWKPMYLRGYVSSIALLSDYIITNNVLLKFKPKGIFTTAEKLYDFQRNLISNAFKSEVFDNYGLYDCGLSAFECECHNGLHIDYENSLFEVVNEAGKNVYETEGKIIGTDFYNYAFPFIRYDTGDYGILSKNACNCGRTSNRITAILGREKDYLEFYGRRFRINDNLMSECNVKQFQVHQLDSNTVKFLIVKLPSYSLENESVIRNSILSNTIDVTVQIEYVEKILPYKNNKFKTVIRHLNGDNT